ncbi:MAG: translation initiation factor IF-5A [Thermoplasmata archaeon]|jgi:translation initiation factor 5A|nr:translation initiation factor IF-5A [Thermoplasmata archaeon]MVT12734.1 translation initiation factor IF-5A [Euryarchaeota archaeon]MVT15024.1 translation initiation factor IF-5A [Euryarchaeota archaeon]MVT35839.1 translation initiation factor IF-5A [Euryarchaeota archaeon]
MSWKDVEVRELREGSYIVIDDEPCRIVEFTTSKPGKHGEAKARIVAIGVFDNQKRSVVYPVKHKVKSPIIDKKVGQIISIIGDTAQIMDTSTFETFELPIPEELKGSLQQGQEVQYWEAMGKRKIMKS